MAESHVVVSERLLLTRDGRVVPAGDPDGVRLYATPGQRVSARDAAKFGIGKDGTVNPNPVTQVARKVGQTAKQLWLGPPSDKARSQRRDKNR